MGTPYAISSDLVSAYPAKSLAIAQYIDGYKTDLAMVQNAQTGTSYSLALADFTKLVTLNNAAAVAVTLPLESTVAWEASTQLRLLNLGAGTVTVAGAVGVTINGTPLTLSQFKAATLVKTGTNTWTFLPFSSGVGAAVFSDTPTGTYTGYAYKTFSSGSSTLTVTTAGFADLVVCGGGGASSGANGGAGGAGGVLQVTNAYLPVGTLTVVVGAGGSAVTIQGSSGNTSRIGSFYSPGGGGGGAGGEPGQNGGSGGGGKNAGAGGSGTSGIGNNGGGSAASGFFGGGGGGGAGAVGSNGTASVGGNGGAGVNVTLAGTTPTGAYVAGNYALGGGGGGGTSGGGTAGTATDGGGAGSASTTGTAGAANKGGGGGGGFGSSPTGANGGSGIVIVRVAV